MLTGSTSLEHFWQRTRNNLHHMSEPQHKDFWLFESSVWFHMLANSMLAIYIPILMLQSGFTLSSILLFYVIFHVINTPTNLLGGYLVMWIGARKTIIIGTLFQIAFFVAYAYIEPGVFSHLLILGALAAIYDALYYTASLYLFMQTTVDVNNSGKNTGILYAIIRSAGLLGPIIGSAALVFGGHVHAVTIAVIISFVISIIPLFFTRLEKGSRATMISLRTFVREKYVVANHLSLALYKVHESIGAVIWPIFIFLFFGSLESVAVLAILVPIVALVFSFISGQINLLYRYHAIGLGALAVALIWIGRLMFADGVWYYTSVVLVGLCAILMQVPIDSNIFRTGNESNPLTASVFKNMVSMGVKGVLFFVLWLTAISYEQSFVIAIIALAALASLSIGRIYLQKKSKSVY